MFFAVGIEGETELESERVTTLENQPTPGEKTTAQPLQAPSASAWGTGSSAEDESPEGTQAEVKIQNVKVRMKALTEAVVTKFRELFSNLQDVTVCTL